MKDTLRRLQLIDSLGATARGCVLIAAVGVVLVIGLALTLAWGSCRSQADGLGLQHRWGPLMGCLVEEDGRWIPIEQLHQVRLER